MITVVPVGACQAFSEVFVGRASAGMPVVWRRTDIVDLMEEERWLF